MPGIARGQCRSLSKDPRRRIDADLPVAVSAPRSYTLGEMATSRVDEDELGEALPITHVLLLPVDETLPSAPFTVAGKLDPSDEGNSFGIMLTAKPVKDRRTLRPAWRRRRPISRIKFGRRTVKVVRLGDPKVGFGRRESLAPGSSQFATQNRKASPPAILTPKMPGATEPATGLISR